MRSTPSPAWWSPRCSGSTRTISTPSAWPPADQVRLRSATTSTVVPVEPDRSLPRRVVATEFNVPFGDGTVADLIDRAFPVVDLRMETP